MRVCRNSDTQVALLDRIAGTAAGAARFGARLRRLRDAEGGLAALDALGDQDDRDALQALVDEVRRCPPMLVACSVHGAHCMPVRVAPCEALDTVPSNAGLQEMDCSRYVRLVPALADALHGGLSSTRKTGANPFLLSI